MKKHAGFTLMELMIVIAIIMILSGAIVARIGTGSEKAKIAKAKAEMQEIAAAARAFYMDTGYWPSQTNALFDDSNGDNGLISKGHIFSYANSQGGRGTDPTNIQLIKDNWKGPYLEAAIWPKDPWGKKYYVIAHNPYSVLSIICSGPDSSWESGGQDAPIHGGVKWENGTYWNDDMGVLVHKF